MTEADREQEKRVVRSERSKRLLEIVCILALVLLLLLTGQNYQRGRENHETLRAIEAQSTVIRSCTTPGEPCFQAAQKRTGEAVSSINRVVILAAACSAGLPLGLRVNQRQRSIQACVITRLATQNAKGN